LKSLFLNEISAFNQLAPSNSSHIDLLAVKLLNPS
jgi:hypothetical protein